MVEIENEPELMLSDGLKSVYFAEQDTVLTDQGTILTSNYDSLAIGAIKQHITDNRTEYPSLLGAQLAVARVEHKVIRAYLETIMADNDPAEMDEEVKSSIGQAAKELLQKAVSLRSSDIHIELYRKSTIINARVDGRIIELRKPIPERDYGETLIGYLFNELADDKDSDFYVTKMNNGRLSMELITGDTRRECQFRISFIPGADRGGQAVLRWLNAQTRIPKIDEIGLEPGQVQVVRDFMASKSGAFLLTGQTGSGKSTTVAAVLTEAKGTGRAINTIEDPIEFDLGVMQTSVNSDEEFTEYGNLLLRHDVDIEMRGEVRTKEGALSVCRKAETGQLMLTTLHTSSTIGIAHTLNKQLGIPLAVIAAPDLMRLWMYQTLVRKLCPHCHLSLEEAKQHWGSQHHMQYERWLQHGVATTHMRFKNPNGCSQCTQGEYDRTVLAELLVLDDTDRHFILKEDYLGWHDHLIEKGYKTVADHANLKIARGEIDLFTTAQRVNGLFAQDVNEVYASMFKEVADVSESRTTAPTG
ncbi:GspE/PulE family protein [Vibrio sp. WXL103]|uniref:GspE/PulE family protein n=1 Tax=unclassified Vibrio TaxID=2614977 RepID=UPI003EC66270